MAENQPRAKGRCKKCAREIWQTSLDRNGGSCTPCSRVLEAPPTPPTRCRWCAVEFGAEMLMHGMCGRCRYVQEHPMGKCTKCHMGCDMSVLKDGICQECQVRLRVYPNATVLKLSAKCSDACYSELLVNGTQVKVQDRYVPSIMPGRDSDYIELHIDIKTGQILNWVVPNSEELDQFISR